MFRTVLLVSLAAAASAALAQGAPVSTPRGSFTATNSGQPIIPPAGPVQVTVQTVTFAAGAILPAHRHPHTRYGYVMSGRIRVDNLDTGQSEVFTAGQPIIEALGQWHSGTALEPTTLLVIDQVPPGQGNIEMKPR